MKNLLTVILTLAFATSAFATAAPTDEQQKPEVEASQDVSAGATEGEKKEEDKK